VLGLHGLQRLFVGCELRLVLVVAGVYGRGRKELVSDPPTPMTGAPLVAETAKAAGGRALAPGIIWIPAGTFLMGSDSHYPEEAQASKVSIDGFWIDRFTVTNREFARFLAKTGHVTVAAVWSGMG